MQAFSTTDGLSVIVLDSNPLNRSNLAGSKLLDDLYWHWREPYKTFHIDANQQTTWEVFEWAKNQFDVSEFSNPVQVLRFVCNYRIVKLGKQLWAHHQMHKDHPWLKLPGIHYYDWFEK